MKELLLTQKLTLAQRLENHWDSKLSLSPSNPFPLAPKDLVRLEAITDSDYLDQNLSWGLFCKTLMEAEVLSLVSEPEVPAMQRHIEVLGGGLCRDLDWLPVAVSAGFNINIREVSGVACHNVIPLHRKLVEEGKVRCIRGDIEKTCLDKEFDAPECMMYFASQFIQVQKPKKMSRLMKRFGSILAKQPQSETAKRMYLVHPFGTDNAGPKKWLHCDLDGVEWGDTTPYDESDLMEAMAHEGSSFRFETLGKHHYFHQLYSFVRITLKDTRGAR